MLRGVHVQGVSQVLLGHLDGLVDLEVHRHEDDEGDHDLDE